MPTMNVGPGSGPELQDIANAMGRSKKFVVVTGAGISTNCGIPDFRSENGLYSLIQAQYDAALQNPPWEEKDNYDIDDRPKKKRKRWFYEVVRDDGTVVDIIDQEAEELAKSQDPEASTSSRKSSRSKSTTPVSSPLSSPPPSSATATPPSEQTDDSAIESSQSSRPDLPNLKGRDLFDSMVWKDPFTTSIFYMFISSLRQKIQDVPAPTPTHEFVKALHDCGRLVRNYTQNIDCLEDRVGLTTDLAAGPGSRTRFTARSQRDQPESERGVSCVQLHGSLAQLRCGLCLKLCSWEESERAETILSGQAPDCPSCTDYNAHRTGRGRRGLAVGRLRPDIVLYGEEHPNATLVGPLITHDLALGPDILLVLGTSLKVHGLKVIVKEFAKTVHDRGGKVIFVNRTKPPESTWGDVIDYWVGWDCDAWVLDLKERRADIWLPQGSFSDESKSRRQSTNETKGETVKRSRTRPQATRDDRSSGVYHTFKILDNLRKVPSDDGSFASRAIYWQDLRRLTGDARDIFKPFSRIDPLSVLTPKESSSTKRKSMPAANSKEKIMPTRKPLPASKSAANSSNKRKSCPAATRDDKGNAAYLVTKIWDDLRKYAPNLPEHPSRDIVESGRIALSELHQNVPSYLKPFSFGITNKSDNKSPLNHLPDIAGLDMPDMNMPNLVTHPPSGLTIPLHTPKQPPPRTNHAYGTRSSGRARWSEGSTIVVKRESESEAKPAQTRLPSWGSTESTIIVATPPHGQEPTSPASSAPMTPGSKRIKRMGSIGAILSSPDDGAVVFEDAQEKLVVSPDGAEVFYDAKMELMP